MKSLTFLIRRWLLSAVLLSGVLIMAGCGGKVAPDVWSVAPACSQPNKVWVQFATGTDRDPLNQTSAETAANYSVSGLSVTSATLYSSDQNVLLTLSGNLVQSTETNVTATNVSDTAGRTQSPSSVTLPLVYHATTQGAMGLYYRNKNLAGSLERTAVDANIDFDVGSGSLGGSGPNNFSVRWYSFIEISQTGDYDLRASTDDGVRVWFQDIDADPTIDAWYDASIFSWLNTHYAADTFTASTQDVGKRLPLVMEYYENSGSAYAHLQWDTPASGSYTAIPSGSMFTCIPAPTTATLASFAVVVPTSASTCADASITITARDSTAATLTSYTGTMTVTTSSNHGDWSVSSGSGTLSNGTADDGSATYTFSSADNGVVTLALSNKHADTLSVTASEAASSVSNLSSNIVFAENAFVISTSDALGADIVSGRNHAFLVQFVRRPLSGAQCAVDTGYTGTKNLKLWRTPTGAGSGGAMPVISSGGSSVSVPTALPATNNFASVSFTSGQANLSMATTDVGQYTLNFRDDSSGYAVDASGNPVVVNGTSSTLTVRPFGFRVTAVSSGGTPNLAASSAAGDAFISAGTPFNLTVAAVRYDSADDTDFDGIPDGHSDSDASSQASLANNAAIASYGNEQSGAGSGSAQLTGAMISPSDGVSTSLSGPLSVTSFTAGAGTVQPYFDNVGIFEIRTTNSNYLGSGRTVYGASGYIGRFIPAWFEVSDYQHPSLAHGHGTCAFTYQGETAGYQQQPVLQITAKTALGTTATNYGNSYWKFPLPASDKLSAAITNLPGGSTTTLTRNTDASLYTWSGTTDYDGIATLNLGGDTFTFNKSTSTGPTSGDSAFTPKLTLTLAPEGLTDADSVCYLVGGTGACSSYLINDSDDTGFDGTELRYARLRLSNVSGTIEAPLLMPAAVEYWKTVGANQVYVPATEENVSCVGTSLSLANLALDNYLGALSSGEVTMLFDNGITAGGSGVISLAVDQDADPATVSGSVRVTLTVPVSLQYNQTGSGIANPAATATFGIYGGRAPIFNIQQGYR